MEIKNIFKSNSQTPPPEYFLAIEIHDSLIKTAVWQVENEVATVVNVGSFESWESEESLINGLDASLSQAVKHLSSEPDRAIFGLPGSWLDADDKLEKNKASLINKIKKDLSIKPIGLVTITEAILQQLKIDEGIPPTAILLEIYITKIIVTLVRLGQIEKQEEVGRGDDIAKDVEEGLVRMNSDRLPVRFLLTNGSDLENEEQQILSYPWQDKLNFLHLPKVETLPADYSIKAIALAGGSEAAKSLGLDVVEEATPVETEDTFSSLGFAIESAAEPEPEVETPAPPARKLPAFPALPKITLPHFRFAFHLPRKAFIFTPALLLLFPIVFYAYYYFFSHVDITVKITPQTLAQTVPLYLSDKPQTDYLAAPAIFKNIELSVSKNQSTTGEAVVGDKAVGSVSIYNRSLTPIVLKAGAKIQTANGFLFSLDAAASIASSSSDLEPPFTSTPGKAEVSVTAVKIGVEGNLPKNTQFTIDSYPKSTLIGNADNDFTKGSSRTVRAVSKDDLDKLFAAVNDEFKTKIDSEVSSQDPDQHSLVIGSYDILKKNYSKDVGAESDTINLDLSVRVPILTYSHSQLTSSLSDQVIKKNQPGLHLVPEKTNIILSQPKKVSDNVYLSDVKVEGVVTPAVDLTAYKSQLAGQTVDKAKTLLQTISGYSNMTLQITPNLPIFNRFLPRNPKHISIQLYVL